MAFKMKGSPHKRGTIEGTSAYKATQAIIDAAAGAYARPVVDVSKMVESISETGKGTSDLSNNDDIDTQLEKLKKRYENGEIDEATYKRKKKELENKRK